MTTLTYIWKIIGKFGLFGRLDNRGLAELQLELEAHRLMESGLPQHSVSVLKRVEDLEKEKIIRNKLESQREELLRDFQTDLPWDVESPIQRFADVDSAQYGTISSPTGISITTNELQEVVDDVVKKSRKPRAKKTTPKRKKNND